MIDITLLCRPECNSFGLLEAPQDEFLAIHEAGHALIAELTGFRVESLTIDSTQCQGLERGCVRLEDMLLDTKQTPIHFGGYLATEYAISGAVEPEYLLCKKPPECGGDLSGVRACLSHFWSTLPSEVQVIDSDHSLKVAFGQACQRVAWKLVAEHFDQCLLPLAEELLKKMTMSGAECRAFLRSINC